MKWFFVSWLLVLAYAEKSEELAEEEGMQEPVFEEVAHTTRQGEIIGQLDVVPNLVHFPNIPYAKAPIGSLRFRPPEALPHMMFSTHRDFAMKKCPQQPSPMDDFFPNAEYTEDCLVLNVWAPKEAIDGEKSDLPVGVWIHGGGFVFGHGFGYNPEEELANDMIFVTINYRLAMLGFYSSEEIEDETEMLTNGAANGLLDQVAALEWVKHNIKDYGGNPDDVTLMGESAGGMSVCLHLISPKSKGLFHKAIIQSGSCLSIWAGMVTKEEGMKTSALTLERAFPDKNYSLEELESLPYSMLMQYILPTPDGYFLDDTAERILNDPDTILNIPEENILIGTNTYETSNMEILSEDDDRDIDEIFKPFEYIWSGKNLETVLENTKDLPRGLPDPKDRRQVIAHTILSCASFAQSRLHPGAFVYKYGFHPDDKVTPPLADEEQGMAEHAAELANFFVGIDAVFPVSQAVKEEMISYWKAFIAGGADALKAKGWKQFGDQEEYLYFGDEQGAKMLKTIDDWGLCDVIEEEMQKNFSGVVEFCMGHLVEMGQTMVQFFLDAAMIRDDLRKIMPVPRENPQKREL